MKDNIPKSIFAEAAVLASCIIEPANIPLVRDQIAAESFFSAANRQIYQAIIELADTVELEHIDLVLVRQQLGSKLEEIGGLDYLVRVTESAPSAATVEYYTAVVRDCWLARGLMSAGQKITEIATEERKSVQDKISEAEKKLQAVNKLNVPKAAAELCQARELLSYDAQEQQQVTYAQTAFSELDAKIYGLAPGDLITIAGRPGMGKSALLKDIWLDYGKRGKKVAVFSLEMSARQLIQQAVVTEANLGLAKMDDRPIADITLKAINDNHLSQLQKDVLDSSAAILKDTKVYIDETAQLTWSRLFNRVLAIRHKYKGLDLVCIDYLQLMKPENPRHGRYEAVSDISNNLKLIARKAEVPVVVAAQLNREVEKRNDKRPKLSDLRDSGSIEQDSDIVLLLYREDYYEETDTGEAELNIAKNRRGKTGKIKLGWIAEWTHFEELEGDTNG